MHYVVLSKCGGCLDTSTLEMSESSLAAFPWALFSHPPTPFTEEDMNMDLDMKAQQSWVMQPV